MGAFRWRFFQEVWNMIDLLIVGLWLVQVAGASFGMNTQFARLARLSRLGRLARLARTIEGFDAMFLMTTSIRGSIGILGWASLLILIILTFEALLIWQVLAEFYFNDAAQPAQARHDVFIYFGTYTRASFTMLELTLANFPPPARLLSENVSQWFMLFVWIHKLTMGFAVIGVINAVFMSETFRVVANDNRIMVRNKQKQLNEYTKKIKDLFLAADPDCDGNVTYEEFEIVFSEPDLNIWMSAMDLKTDDLPMLYKLLDCEGGSSDGRLQMDELVKGVAHLRGAAKSIDLIILLNEVRELKAALAHSMPNVFSFS